MRNGNSVAVNLALNAQFSASPSHEWPTILAQAPNSEAILLGTRSSRVIIHTSSKATILGDLYLDAWGITSINIHGDIIVIGSSDGKIHTFDIQSSVQEAFVLLEEGDYEKLSLLVEENPFVFINSSLCLAIEERYNEIFLYHPVAEKEKKGYEHLVALILSNSAKRSELLRVVRNSELFAPFSFMVGNADYEDACKLALNHPLLRQLREFTTIHNRCNKNITYQIELLEEDIHHFHEYMKTQELQCRNCYYGIVPPAPALEEGFKKLQIALSTKDFASFMQIIEKFPIFKRTRLYRRLMTIGEALIDKILLSMQASQMKEAYIYASKLLTIKIFERTAQDFQKQILNYGRFSKAIKLNNIEQIFQIASQNPVLKTTTAFKSQVNIYRNIYKNLHSIAKKGDIAQIVSILSVYEKIPYFHEKNLQLYRFALINGILLHVRMGEEIVAPQEYHRCFGWDENYEKACETLNVDIQTSTKSSKESSLCKELVDIVSRAKSKRAKI
jgi:hypothetical protein